MKGALGRVIYVGKAASLRSRVRQYFQDSGYLENPRIKHLMSKIADFDYVATDNERGAQLRDQVRGMEAIYERQRIASTGLEDRDVAAVAQSGDVACGQMFFIRAGRGPGQGEFLLVGGAGRAAGGPGAGRDRGSGPAGEVAGPAARWAGERGGAAAGRPAPPRGTGRGERGALPAPGARPHRGAGGRGAEGTAGGPPPGRDALSRGGLRHQQLPGGRGGGLADRL